MSFQVPSFHYKKKTVVFCCCFLSRRVNVRHAVVLPELMANRLVMADALFVYRTCQYYAGQ